MSRIAKLIFILSGYVFFAGCYFTSVQPITQQPTPGADPKLLGLWKTIPDQSEASQEENYLFFMEETDGHLIILLIEDHYRFSEMYRGFISQVNGVHYLNVKTIKPSEKSSEKIIADEYTIVLYQINQDNQLQIYMLNEKKMREAVEHHQLAGSITQGRFTDDIRITASSEQWALYLNEQKINDLSETKALVSAVRVYQIPNNLK